MRQGNQNARRASMPPGSALPTVLQSAAFGLRPLAAVRCWRRRFGDLFTIRLLPTGPFAYLVDPDGARAVLRGDRGELHAGEANRMLEPVNGPRSVVVLDEDRHDRARQLLLPLFRPPRLAAHRPLIERLTIRELESWPRDRPFRLAPRMQDLALEVIVRTTLGSGDEKTVTRLRELLPALLRANTLTWLPGLGRELGPLSPAGRRRRLVEAVDTILHERIRRRRAAGPDGDSSLDQLLGARPDGHPLDDEELRDHLATLLLSGHETTSSALAWAFERLVRHPAVVARLRTELEDGGEEYLEAVVKEVLRSRPAVMDTGRVLQAPCRVAGSTLPAGSQVRVAIAAIQSRPDLFPRPADFRPERFLDGEVDQGDWIPFGGGARRCLGAALATLEMKIVIATVVGRTELRADRPRAERAVFKAPHLTLSPARGARVVARPRAPLPGR